jgi:hypothetical protein
MERTEIITSFYATTNEGEPLRDHTGARRYWPVRCAGVNRGFHVGLEEEVDQLWAEAMMRYRAGEKLYMEDATLLEKETEAQEGMTVEDDDFELVRAYLDRLWPENWESLSLAMRQDIAQGRLEDPLVKDLEFTVRRDIISMPQIKEELYGIPRNEQHRNDKLGRILPGIMTRMPGWKKCGMTQYTPVYGTVRAYVRAGSEEEYRSFSP